MWNLVKHISSSNLQFLISLPTLFMWSAAVFSKREPARQRRRDLTHVIVLDFEATCWRGRRTKPQEIIEFPSVLVDLRSGSVVDEVQIFVRPVHHATLSAFCTKLTGIEQADVAGAPVFHDAVREYNGWLVRHGMTEKLLDGTAVIVTCGDWDLRTMLPAQCRLSRCRVPRYLRSWSNVKNLFKMHVATQRRRSCGCGMVAVLQYLDVELEGRHHSGIDDCRNIARIVLRLIDEVFGAVFEQRR